MANYIPSTSRKERNHPFKLSEQQPVANKGSCNQITNQTSPLSKTSIFRTNTYNNKPCNRIAAEEKILPSTQRRKRTTRERK